MAHWLQDCNACMGHTRVVSVFTGMLFLCAQLGESYLWEMPLETTADDRPVLKVVKVVTVMTHSSSKMVNNCLYGRSRTSGVLIFSVGNTKENNAIRGAIKACLFFWWS
jgi:hypothetical protein